MTRAWWAARARYWFTPIALVIVGAPVPGFVFASILRHSPQWWGLAPVVVAAAMVGLLGHARARADERRRRPVYVDEGQQYDDVGPLADQLHAYFRGGAWAETPIDAMRRRAEHNDPTLRDRGRREAEAAEALLADIRTMRNEESR